MLRRREELTFLRLSLGSLGLLFAVLFREELTFLRLSLGSLGLLFAVLFHSTLNFFAACVSPLPTPTSTDGLPDKTVVVKPAKKPFPKFTALPFKSPFTVSFPWIFTPTFGIFISISFSNSVLKPFDFPPDLLLDFLAQTALTSLVSVVNSFENNLQSNFTLIHIVQTPVLQFCF